MARLSFLSRSRTHSKVLVFRNPHRGGRTNRQVALFNSELQTWTASASSPSTPLPPLTSRRPSVSSTVPQHFDSCAHKSAALLPPAALRLPLHLRRLSPAAHEVSDSTHTLASTRGRNKSARASSSSPDVAKLRQLKASRRGAQLVRRRQQWGEASHILRPLRLPAGLAGRAPCAGRARAACPRRIRPDPLYVANQSSPLASAVAGFPMGVKPIPLGVTAIPSVVTDVPDNSTVLPPSKSGRASAPPPRRAATSRRLRPRWSRGRRSRRQSGHRRRALGPAARRRVKRFGLQSRRRRRHRAAPAGKRLEWMAPAGCRG